MNNPIYLKNVVTLSLDQDKCNGCSMCINVCPHEVFEIIKAKAHIINIDACMECGACAKNCDRQALSVTAGVGCAAGIINGIIRNTEPTCDCNSSGCC